jgi:hypothetical protein
MKAIRSPETSVPIRATRRNIPEGDILQQLAQSSFIIFTTITSLYLDSLNSY